MPNKPPRGCGRSGCPNLTLSPSGLCEYHEKQRQQLQDNTRGTASERGYDSRWRKVRLLYLAEHPLCVICQQEGIITAATVVDHIKAHRGDYSLMWDETNWQALCSKHHSIKTATQDGAFGNKESRG